MLAHELRQLYVDFFKERAHLHLPSAPLVPVDVLGEEDTTTLFTGSGMQQFKPFFTGAATPPSGRVATVQKCVRTGDIDSVGDFSHCTFFEMLGNFSFGDYFKAEVIPWTWEFLTQKVGLEPDRFEVTVFLDDDEAYNVWRNVVGLPEDRIHRLGEDKNYWPANAISEGIAGPCGPCSEVYYRVAPEEEYCSDPTLTPTERWKIDDDAGRWLEVWNNVFTQFDLSLDEQGKSVLTPLPRKNNDTGAGFDRIVQVHQGKRSVFETDLFQPILNLAAELAGKQYGGTMEPADFALRVIAEHSRTMVFCIADGVLPSNEGRGYVLRYIMRRAIRFSKVVLGIDEPFLHEIASVVIDQMGEHYTELRERSDLILRSIQDEEERFRRTLVLGLNRLENIVNKSFVQRDKVLPGNYAFMMYDTYGFPLEMLIETLSGKGIRVDVPGFHYEMEKQRERSRASGELGGTVFGDQDQLLALIDRSIRGGGPTVLSMKEPKRADGSPTPVSLRTGTEFIGYGKVTGDATVLAIIHEGALVDSARAGDEVTVLLNRSPFYAEAGGQVGDTGWLTAPAGDTTCALRVTITDTKKKAEFHLHVGRIEEGEVYVGQQVHASVDAERRRHVRRNHTTTHLLQAALRQVLGSHVHQKGSLVAPSVLRFDFTHTQPMTAEEIWRVEEIVNRWILEDDEVKVHQDIPIEEAKQRGAMALFGEKYGDRVRMIEVPGVSLELCGGIHLTRTSEAVLFKITSESGIGSGVRRIEAQTGRGAVDHVNDVEKRLDQVARLLKSNSRDVLVAAEKLVKERSDLQKEVQRLKSGTQVSAGDLQTAEVSGVTLVTGALPSADGETLANLADREAQKRGSAVVVLGGAGDGKVQFVAKVTPDLVKRGAHAGNLIREVAKVAGGGGGGRPDFAQAGGRDASKLQEALAKAGEVLAGQLK